MRRAKRLESALKMTKGGTMAQSLRQRFNGNSGEVLDYARRFGICKAMEEYGVKDYLSMQTFLASMAPGETFNAGSENYDAFADPQAFDRLVEATQRYIAKLETKCSQYVAENERLKAENESYKKKTWNSRKPLINNLQMQISKENIDF